MKRNFIATPKGGVDILLVALISCFILHSVIGLFSQHFFDYIYQYFSLSYNGIMEFYLWTPLTYPFLHDGPFHLIMNLLGLYFIGKGVEYIIGTTNFWYLAIIGSTCGCSFWLLTNSNGGFLIGASAIVMSCLSYYCLKNPSTPITLLIFFILPCRIKPKWVLLAVLFIDLYGFIFSELNNSGSIAHSAHLGGLMGGALVFFYLQSGRVFPKFVLKKSKTMFENKFSSKSKGMNLEYKVNFSTTDEIQNEVDRILDKINDSGFGSLTKEEKLTLEKSKGLL